MNPGSTYTTQDHPTLSGDQLDALERTYQSQLVSLILGRSDPVIAKGVLDTLGEHLRAGCRDPVNIITGATKIAQGIRGLGGE